MTRTHARGGLAATLAPATVLLLGCAHVENQFREDGPSFGTDWRSPTEVDVRENNEPTIVRRRAWEPLDVSVEDGRVSHFPVHFEDPFEDKGAEALSLTNDEYKWRCTDIVGTPWCYARHWLNIVAYPVSVIVTPPWTLMESDGQLSKQALGYDHDAARANEREALTVPPGMGWSDAGR